MKTLKLIVCLVALVGLTFSCKQSENPEIKTVITQVTEKQFAEGTVFEKASFKIEGMTCAVGCAGSIQKKLNAMPGIKEAKVDFDQKTAFVEYDKASIGAQELFAAVTKAGDKFKTSAFEVIDVDLLASEQDTLTIAKGKTCKSGSKKTCCKGKDGKKCSKECKKKCSKEGKKCSKSLKSEENQTI